MTRQSVLSICFVKSLSDIGVDVDSEDMCADLMKISRENVIAVGIRAPLDEVGLGMLNTDQEVFESMDESFPPIPLLGVAIIKAKKGGKWGLKC